MKNIVRSQKREYFCHKKAGITPSCWEKLPEDASTRTYFRLQDAQGKSFILLDDEQRLNKCPEFVQIAELLRSFEVHAPKIEAFDVNEGLILLEDLGNNTLNKLLTKGGSEHDLYNLATQALIKIARIDKKPEFVPELSAERVVKDVSFFTDWYVPLATGLPWSDKQRTEFNELIKELIPLGYRVPNTLVLWDYHVDNVMLPSGDNDCAVLDFQDAMWGPLTYDIMSLVEDARRIVAPSVHQEMKELFWKSLKGVGWVDFETSFAFWGIFRHFRVLGRFSFLLACHGKGKYIKFVPHLWNMLERSLNHPALDKLNTWLTQNLPDGKRVLPKMKPINKALLLAAGRGTRMRELTDHQPKSLVQLCGKSLIDYGLDCLSKTAVKNVVINLCYRGNMIKEHLKKWHDMQIVFSEEETALETGGGVKKALPLMGDGAFLLLNCDNFCTDEGNKPEMWRLIDAWDESCFDILLLLVPLEKVAGDSPGQIGDYRQKSDSLWERNVNKTEGFPYLYTGWAVVHPRALVEAPEGAFSLRDIFDELAKNGRLGMLVAQSTLFQIGSPEAIKAAESLIKK